ncbi:MAG: DUF2306 domain-containing protein [Pseudomonadota bacterium]
MDFTPLFSASQPIPLYALLAIAALVLGGLQFLLPKGTRLHRLLGHTWAAAMAIVAISSFFIWEIRLWGLFSPIHLLSIFTLASLALGIRAARMGRIRTHRFYMIGLYGGGLVITGGFTLLPGRIMYQVLFG